MEIRRLAQQKFGKKLLTNLDATVGHIQKPDGKIKVDPKLAFQTAAAELMLFSLTDFQVVGNRTGFGRTAAAWSGLHSQVYAVDHDPKKSPPRKAKERSCGLHDFDSIIALSKIRHKEGGPGL